MTSRTPLSVSLRRETSGIHQALHSWPAARRILNGTATGSDFCHYLHQLGAQDRLLGESVQPFAEELRARGIELPPSRSQSCWQHAQQLDAVPAFLPVESEQLELQDRFEALGVLYVWVGSFQGGDLIRKKLQSCARLRVLSSGYRSEPVEPPKAYWRELLLKIDSVTEASQQDAVLNGAVMAFRSVHSVIFGWLPKEDLRPSRSQGSSLNP